MRVGKGKEIPSAAIRTIGPSTTQISSCTGLRVCNGSYSASDVSSIHLLRRVESRSRRKAQRLIAAATMVTTMYQGSFARCGPSSMTRQKCAKVSKPKSVPVVTRYAFMESPTCETVVHRVLATQRWRSLSVSGSQLAGRPPAPTG